MSNISDSQSQTLSMSTSPDACAGITSNPDIVGIGVRVAIYLQTVSQIVLTVIPFISHARMVDARWNLNAFSLALCIAGLISSFKRDVVLLDALLVSNILQGAEIVLWCGYGDLFHSKSFKFWENSRQDPAAVIPWGFILLFSNWIRSALTCVYSLHVWYTVKTFGSSPECNASTSWFFIVVTKPAVGDLTRKFNLVMSTAMAVVFLVRTIFTALSIILYLRAGRPGFEIDPFAGALKVIKKTVGVISTYLLSMIITTEVMLVKNRATIDGYQWSFGQILPLLVAILDLLRTLITATRFLRHLKDDTDSVLEEI